jgi:PAS domain-containing protein
MSTLPLTQPHLPLIAACAKALASDRPFGPRIEQALQVLRTLVYFYDARLVYWRDVTAHQSYTVALEGTLSAPWDEAYVAQAQLATTYWSEPGSVAVAHAGGAVVSTEFRSHLLPIIWNDTAVGFIEMRTASDVMMTSGELATLQAVLPLFAAQIDIAISQMPLTLIEHDDSGLQDDTLVQASQQLDLAQLLSRLRHDFDPPLPLHSLLPLILSRGMEYTGAEAGSIMYVDHDQQELELIEAVGYTIAQLPSGQIDHKRHRWSWENGIAGKVARSARPLLVREITQDVDYFYAEKPDVRAKLAIPITIDGRAHAVMILDSTRSHAFGDRESALALGVAEAAVQPLRRSLRYQELLERSTQLSQVFNSIPSGMALLDRHGQVLRHNPAFLSIWGLTTAQVGPGFRIPFDLLALLMPRFHDSAAFSDFCTNGQAKRDLEHSLTSRVNLPRLCRMNSKLP